MFSPYREARVVANVPGAACICPWRKQVIVGRSDGSITILRSEVTSGDPQQSQSWQIQTTKRIGPAVLQLTTVADRDLILCLTDEGVNLYSLPQLLLKGQAGRTNGASLFAWDDATSQLAAVVKKRVYIHKYDGREFVLQREVALPEIPISLQLVGGTVFAATKKECAAYLATGSVVKIQQGDQAYVLTRLQGSHVMLTCGTRSVVYEESGAKVSKTPIMWNREPRKIVLAKPYIAGLEEGSAVEVQLLTPFATSKMSQTLGNLPQHAVVGETPLDDGSFFLLDAALGNVLQVQPLPLVHVAEQLLELGEYEDALALCRLISEDQATQRKASEARIHLEYGRHLLRQQRYEEGLVHLGMTNLCSPLEVLSHFSFLVPQRLLEEAGGTVAWSDASPSSKTQDIEKTVSTLSPYLLSFRSRLMDDECSTDKQQRSSEEDAAQRSVAVLLDTALLNALLIMPDSGALLQFLQRLNYIDLEAGSAALKKAGRYAELVALLKSKGRHAAALDLLEKLTLRPESLAVKPQGAAAELRGLPGIWAAVKYLTTLGAPDFSLMSYHARWIVEGDSEAGVDMFVHLYPDIDPSVVLPILAPFGSELAATYLQRVIDTNCIQGDQYEQELAMLYLQTILSGTADPSTPSKMSELILSSDRLDFDSLLKALPPTGVWEIRAALLERLDRHLEALRIYVHKLQSPSLAEAYCDRVNQRLRLLLPASSLLPAIPARTGWDSTRENVYTTLVKVLLEEEDSNRLGSYISVERDPHDPQWEDIALLMSRKQDAVHPLQALKLLPGELPISACLTFLEAAFWGSSEERRRASLLTSLYRSRHVNAMAMSTTAEQMYVGVTQERACWVCNKKLGVAAIVYLHNTPPAHYSCYRRSQTNH